MTFSARSQRWPSAVMGVLALCLTLMIAACGSAGSNEDDDDSQFPEPPGRPSAVQVDSATVSSMDAGAVPVYMTTPAVVSDTRR